MSCLAENGAYRRMDNMTKNIEELRAKAEKDLLPLSWT